MRSIMEHFTMPWACVFLPCEVEDWWEDKKLFLLLSHVRSVDELGQLIAAHGRGDRVMSRRLSSLAGLRVFLAQHCTQDEQKVFLSTTLPFIAKSASSLDERVPESGIPFLGRQEAASLVLGRKLVISLLANAFLSTFPPVDPEGGGENLHRFNFDCFFAVFLEKNESHHKSQAAKLKCILSYFRRVSEGNCDLQGVITLRRQVLLRSELPSVSEWQGNQYPLCPIVVDKGKGIEDAESHTLQVDFANSCIGGSTLGRGCVQEEIRFCLCPELLVSMLVMAEMGPNEAIIITGIERFSDYKGYGSSLQFGGDHTDQCQRDVFGNILTSLVAIDAMAFLPPLKPEEQYRVPYMLRDLNKAYTGFLCQLDRGDISTELLALKVKRASVAMLEESYTSVQPQQHNALGNVDVPCQTDGPVPVSMSTLPPISIPTNVLKEPSPLSPIKEVSESPRASLDGSAESPKLLLTDSASSNLVSSILKAGIQMAVGKGGMLSMAAPTAASGGDDVADSAAAGAPEAELTEEPVSDAANRIAWSLANSIIEGVINKEASRDSTKPEITKSEHTKEPGSDAQNQFQIQSITDSTGAGAKSAPTAGEGSLEPKAAEAEGTKKPAESDAADHVAASLTSLLFKEIKETKAAETEGTKKPAESDAADRVAASLTSLLFKEIKETAPAKKPTSRSVDDVVASLTESIFRFSPPPPPVTGTSEQPLNTSAEIQSQAAELAKSIISDILSERKAPSVPFQGPTQTVAQQSNSPPTSRREVATFASHLARSIVLDAVVTVQSDTAAFPVPAGPAIVVQGVEERRGSRESGQSSRSSSFTGQSLTLHEFTDGLVESAIRGVTESFSWVHEARADEHKDDEPKADEPRVDDPKADEGTADEPKADEPKADEGRADEPGADQGSKAAPAVTSTVVTDDKDSGVKSFAEQLVSQSILSVLQQPKAAEPKLASSSSVQDNRPKTLHQGGRPAGLPKPPPPTVVRPAASTVMPKKRLSIGSEHSQTESSGDAEPQQLNPALLSTPSSRMSYAWSVASTRDEDSRPVSPTDLDRIALGLTSTLEEYAILLAEMVIREGVLEASGTDPRSPRLPSNKQDCSAPLESNLPGDGTDAHIDSFLQTLEQADPPTDDEVDAMTASAVRWHKMRRTFLRPVATGNWGCGAFGGDPQLKAMLQWVAVSAAGRPQMLYFPFSDKRVEKLQEVGRALMAKQWTAGRLFQAVLDYCKLGREEREKRSLFDCLQNPVTATPV